LWVGVLVWLLFLGFFVLGCFYGVGELDCELEFWFAVVAGFSFWVVGFEDYSAFSAFSEH